MCLGMIKDVCHSLSRLVNKCDSKMYVLFYQNLAHLLALVSTYIPYFKCLLRKKNKQQKSGIQEIIFICV